MPTYYMIAAISITNNCDICNLVSSGSQLSCTPVPQPQPSLSACSEHSIVAVRASVMVYDDMQKKWLPSGTSPGGISKVHIYHHPSNATFRIVGRKVQDHEVSHSYTVHILLKVA